MTTNHDSLDYYTAQELLKHGYSFAELMRLADQSVIRRRRRVNYKGDEIFTFCEDDLIAFRNKTEVADGE